MNYVLVFRPEVREELNEAYSWYESQQTGLGDDFLDCVDEMLNRIGFLPESYPVISWDVLQTFVLLSIFQQSALTLKSYE